MLAQLPLFLGKIGTPELILILVLLLVFFGGKKIPDLMKGMGRGIKEFKDAVSKDYSSEIAGEDKKADTKEVTEVKENEVK